MSNEKQAIAQVTTDELSMVEENMLNRKQLQHLLKSTPKQYVHQRPAKGGGKWDYVTVAYVQKVLNLMFGWDWDFEVIKDNQDQVLMGASEAVVLGRLTCRVRTESGIRTIVKMQYGNKEVIKKRGTEDPLSIGNDLKAAASDALKKCASEIGIASDIYGKDDFRAVQVTDGPVKGSKPPKQVQ